jgi:6-phosphogluconolactonase
MNAKIIVAKEPSELFERAARLISESANAAVQAGGQFSIALSGGSTPKALFELLASDRWNPRIPWEHTQAFWGDERYVPHDDTRSNYRMAREALLEKVPILTQNIHPIPTNVSPEDCALAYESTLQKVLGPATTIDFNLLGLGENGHTASLFPGRPTLRERSRLVVADFIPEVNMHRITMTAPMINASRTIAFLVTGAGKADVVRDVIAGPSRPEELPSQMIHADNGELLWLLDSAAASKLPAQLVTKTDNQ